MTTSITVTAFTDTGLVRDHNEDAILVDGWLAQTATGALVTMQFDPRAPFVCAVADGMGGHAGGELASRVALGLVADAAPSWTTATDAAATLVTANDWVRNVGADPDLHGLGTTIAGVCVLDDEVIVFNVGDSRVYRIDQGFLQQVSVDDSVLDVDGKPTNVITASLGQTEPVSPHLETFARDGASYLICSDGVSGSMSAAGLRAAAMQLDPRECATSIIEGTRSNGADDNFSLLIVDVPAGDPTGGDAPDTGEDHDESEDPEESQ